MLDAHLEDRFRDDRVDRVPNAAPAAIAKTDGVRSIKHEQWLDI